MCIIYVSVTHFILKIYIFAVCMLQTRETREYLKFN